MTIDWESRKSHDRVRRRRKRERRRRRKGVGNDSVKKSKVANSERSHYYEPPFAQLMNFRLIYFKITKKNSFHSVIKDENVIVVVVVNGRG